MIHGRGSSFFSFTSKSCPLPEKMLQNANVARYCDVPRCWLWKLRSISLVADAIFFPPADSPLAIFPQLRVNWPEKSRKKKTGKKLCRRQPTPNKKTSNNDDNNSNNNNNSNNKRRSKPCSFLSIRNCLLWSVHCAKVVRLFFYFPSFRVFLSK